VQGSKTPKITGFSQVAGATMKAGMNMDAETIATLKIVCTAGRASSGFNDDSNARLEQLAQDGLLVAVSINKPKGPRRAYKPTEKGKEVMRQLASQGAA
jgi:hypothetical protein